MRKDAARAEGEQKLKYREELDWILYKSGMMNRETGYSRSIAIVHSPGLKCDCVGWSTLDLSKSGTEGILDKIEAFCREDGWQVRPCALMNLQASFSCFTGFLSSGKALTLSTL